MILDPAVAADEVPDKGPGAIHGGTGDVENICDTLEIFGLKLRRVRISGLRARVRNESAPQKLQGSDIPSLALNI